MTKEHHILVLRTNINKKRTIKKIKLVLNDHPYIIDWSIDTEDIDKVLRVKANREVNENDISTILKSIGIYGEDLDNK